LMETDSEELLLQGLATGAATFADFLEATDWSPGEIDKSICHQVGSTHQRQMLEAIGLPLARDYATYPWLGNTGSVALPVTLALAVERGFIGEQEQVALLGIGSGINSLMIGVDWQRSPVQSPAALPRPHFAELAAPHSPAP